MNARIFFLLIPFAVLFQGCNGESSVSPENDYNGLEPRSYKVGISGLIPQNYPSPADSDWEELFDSLPDYGDYLGIHVGWKWQNVRLSKPFHKFYNLAEDKLPSGHG
jgi:hypothetical protein